MSSLDFQSRLFESCQKHSSRIAVEYGEKAVSYSLLEEQAARFSGMVIKKGIKKGCFIGIYIEDRIDFISVLIGILKAGCVFVPLDTTLPVKRIKKMLCLTGTRVLFTDTLHYKQLLEQDPGIEEMIDTFFFIDSFKKEKERNQQPLVNEKDIHNGKYHPEDKIYIYFTSGSTGEPKAIVGKNKGLLHFINWEIDTFTIDRETRVSQLMTPGFDAFLKDVFVPFCAGGTVCIPANKEIIGNIDELSRWIEKSKIHLIHTFPSLFRLLGILKLGAENFQHLKYVLLSGEKIKPHELEKWYDTFGERIQLVNLYGPTETTLIKTFYFIKTGDLQKGKIPIGKPMRGAQVILFDKKMNICDPGIVGEIYIRTPYCTFGYYDNNELNRESFIPNPLTGDSSDLLYKTGDSGKELPDGNFEFLGRIDHQVKIRGVRIEPQEIEQAIEAYTGVNTAVVIPIENHEGESVLSAFFVAENQLKKSNIREYLFSLLPDYMIPPYLVQLEKIPLLPNGKTDRKKLKTISLQVRLETQYIPPRNPFEKKLVNICSEILNREKIGMNDDFFELGGKSFDIMRLASGIKRDFDIEMTVIQLFKNSIIGEIATYISSKQKEVIHHFKEHQDETSVIFNKGKSQKLFCFPPQLGYGILYKELAQILEDYEIYSFNFIEDENRIHQYTDIIMEIREKGPYRLFGYSAGGNLAFEIAKEIEKRGGQAGDVIIMDSFRRQVKFRLGTAGDLNHYFNHLEKGMDHMGIGFLKERVIDKARKYTYYFENSFTRGEVNANIHLITAADRKQREAQLVITEPGKEGTILVTGWERNTTKKYCVYQGFGTHMQMLDRGIVEKNAAIIKKILEKAST